MPKNFIDVSEEAGVRYLHFSQEWIQGAMRIQRPNRRSVLTALNDCDPPDTCMTANVRPCVGRMPCISSGR